MVRESIEDVSDTLKYVSSVVTSLLGSAGEHYNIKLCKDILHFMKLNSNLKL